MMANKSRILYLLQFLQSHSDEDHPVTTAEIKAKCIGQENRRGVDAAVQR